MPRNKTAKRTNKDQTTLLTLANLQKVEKEFLTIPSKLAAHINKALMTNKQQGARLKTALTEAQKQIKQIEIRINAANAVKHTTTGKKQLLAAKKKYQKAMKAFTALKQQVAEIAKTSETLALKQAKLLALSKHLNQFEKDWKKQPATSSKKTTTKKKSKKTVSKVAADHPLSESHTHVETIETIVDNSGINNEVSEVA